jgi:hypothetical protein
MKVMVLIDFMQQVSKVILFLRKEKFAARAPRVRKSAEQKKRYFTNELHTKLFWRP